MIVAPNDSAIMLTADESAAYLRDCGGELRKAILAQVHAIAVRGCHVGDVELTDDRHALLALFTIDRASEDEYAIGIMQPPKP